MPGKITNLLKIENGPADLMATVQQWVATLECEDVNQPDEQSVLFTTEWEPPFKALKKLSQEHSEATFTLWGDAFATDHWIAKSIFVNGKSEDWVVSMVDEDFETIFPEVYAQSYEQWCDNRSAPFSDVLAKTSA